MTHGCWALIADENSAVAKIDGVVATTPAVSSSDGRITESATSPQLTKATTLPAAPDGSFHCDLCRAFHERTTTERLANAIFLEETGDAALRSNTTGRGRNYRQTIAGR